MVPIFQKTSAFGHEIGRGCPSHVATAVLELCQLETYRSHG